MVHQARRAVNFHCTAVTNEMSAKRKYVLKKRAEEMAATRRRITEAAVELHGSVGPARTTISAVAGLAGVQRHTLYRHFPTEGDLFAACSAHYFTTNPAPNPEQWSETSDPRLRLTLGLDEFYAFYERVEPMLSKVLRDLELVESLRPTVEPLEQLLSQASEVLIIGWPVRGRRRQILSAALRHTIDFYMWRSLAASELITRGEAVRLATALVEAAAAPE